MSDKAAQLRESLGHLLFDMDLEQERASWECDHPASEPYDPDTEWDDFWRDEYRRKVERILALPEIAALGVAAGAGAAWDATGDPYLTALAESRILDALLRRL